MRNNGLAGRVEQRLRELNVLLPPPPVPSANYVPFVRHGQFLQLSGVAPVENGQYLVTGKLGRDLNLDDGRRAARVCGLNALANLKLACGGDLNRVQRIMIVRGFVNVGERFSRIPLVLDGASDLIVDVLGPDVGPHARTSIGCSVLPGNVAVELDVLAVIDEFV